LLTVPAYIHLIGVDRYGVLVISWLLLGYSACSTSGWGATIHRIAELRDAEPAARLATFHTAVAVNVAIGVVGGLVLALGASLFFAWPQDRAGASWRIVGCGAAAWPVAADCHADGG
jgi:hypothetical protein